MSPTTRTSLALALMALVLSSAHPSVWAEDAEAEAHETTGTDFRVTRWANWLFMSFLQDQTDDNQTWGIELESKLGFGRHELKNISYFEVNQYDRGVPGQPVGNPNPGVQPADGIGDLLTAFWLSMRDGHHGKHHFAPGMAFQFPTADSDTLGSGKWSLGPSIDYEYESGRLFAGAIALQVWSVGGDPDRKDVSMLMIKPFVFYSLSKDWDLLYLPYGITVYWNKPEGEKVYLPLGGGVQRGISLGSTRLNLAAQYFRNVVRPTKGTVHDVRFLVEFAF